MELRKWQGKFASRILQRGENYYYDGAVRAMKWNGREITATVEGTEDYKVRITVSDGIVGRMSCTCLYAEEDNCKHMAAVLFEASGDDFPGENGEYERDSEMPLEEAVQALSASDAKILLLRWARQYPDIAEQIRVKATGGVSKEQVRKWMEEVSKLTEEYSGRDHFIEYGEASAYTDEMVKLLSEKVELLLDAGMPADAFALTCKVCEEVSTVDIDDSDGGTGWVCLECAERWREILPHMSLAQQHQMFDWIQEHYDRWDAPHEAMDGFLFGDDKREAAFQKPEFLRRKLELLDESIARAGGSRYRLESYVTRRLDIMKQASVNREEMEAFIHEHYNLPLVRQRLIDEAVQQERFEDAIELLRRSKEMDAQYPGLVHDYSTQLIEIFQTLNRPQELRRELLYQMENVSQQNLQYVNLLKDSTPPENWPALREKLLSAPNLSRIHRELMEQEGLYRRLMDSVLQSKSLLTMDKFYKTLAREYPDETREFYISCLRTGMEQALNRNAYAEYIRYLPKLNGIRGGKEAAAALAEEWRKAYPRRRAMLDELKKRGF